MSTADTPRMNVDEISYPPTIIIQDTTWRLDIATNAHLRRIFNESLIQAISAGQPESADRVLGVLSHWITCPGTDQHAIQHTYALRLRLDAYLYRHAIETRRPDSFALKLLGACSIGRQIALRLTHSYQLDNAAPWQLYTLWDWIESKDSKQVVCTLENKGVEIRVAFNPAELHRNTCGFLLVGSDLWPRNYPVLNLGAITSRLMEGYAVDIAVHMSEPS